MCRSPSDSHPLRDQDLLPDLDLVLVPALVRVQGRDLLLALASVLALGPGLGPRGGWGGEAPSR